MNATKETEACRNSTEHWINKNLHPRVSVDRVEVCVIVAGVLMIVLATLAPRRRQSQSIIVRYGVEGVYALSFPLIAYTFGLMGGKFSSQLYPVWAIFLGMLIGGTVAMSAQKLDEIKQPVKLYWYYIFFFVLSLATILKGRLHIWFIVIFLDFLLVFKALEQLAAANLASKPSSDNGIERLARYMKHEHQLSTSYDALTKQGYKYAVLIHAGNVGTGGSPITLEEIWSGNIGVLSTDSPRIRRLKDLCLSFSLFHLVVRRYFGYTCPESKLDKTRDLVLHGLMRTEQGYERAFHVIEAELAFLYDFFFTKYAFIMYGGDVWLCAISLTLIFVSIAVGAWSLHVLNPHPSLLDDQWVEASTRDVIITIVLLGLLSMFQLAQIWSYCVSDWAKVSCVCKYVTRPAWQGNARIKKLILFLGRPHKWLRYWRNDLGQYSVLDSFSSSNWDRLKHLLPSGKAGKPVELSMEVKRAVALAIKNSINGHLSNGSSALMRHGMSDDLCWACQINDEFSLTHSILVWHIATTYCEISERVRHQQGNDVHPHKVVATSLSKYCAHLVAFAPTLLPGSAVETECTLKELEGEVKGALRNLVSPMEKYEKLRQLHNESRETMPAQLSMLTKGITLGEALDTLQNGEIRWNLLADFWAAMMVRIAPSDNVAGHIEKLAEGGEFVTHVWALLMHAGILERPAAGTAVP